MRKAILLIAILAMIVAICTFAAAQGKSRVDPNSSKRRTIGQSAGILNDTDSRLDQKVTYQVKLRPIADVVNDLTKLSGIKMFAGRSVSDWRVREDITTVYAKDLPFRTIMDSLARVMKFKWVRSGTAPNWTYRLIEDPAEIARILKLEEERKSTDATARRKVIDKLMRLDNLSPEELAKLRENNPVFYLYFKSGRAKPIIDLLKEVPEVKDALIAGEQKEFAASALSPRAQKALLSAAINIVKCEYRIYIAEGISPAEMNNLDDMLSKIRESAGKLQITIPKAAPYSSSSMLAIGGSEYCGAFEIYEPLTARDKLYGQLLLKAFEEERSTKDIRQEMKPQFTAALQSEKPQRRLWDYTDDLIADQPDSPELHIKTSRKIDDTKISAMVFSLAEASGLSIVTDNFRGKINYKVTEGTELKEALSSIPEWFARNWQVKNGVIELFRRNWYEDRQARVSQAWLEKMRRKMKEKGTLDIDDLAEIACLTDQQLSRNIYRDSVLRPAAGVISGGRDYLRIYSSLTSGQRTLLFSEDGLDFTGLSANQQRATQKIIPGINDSLLNNIATAAAGLWFTCTRELEGKQFVYTLRIFTGLGPMPEQYSLRTPLYVEPTKPQKVEAPK